MYVCMFIYNILCSTIYIMHIVRLILVGCSLRGPSKYFTYAVGDTKVNFILSLWRRCILSSKQKSVKGGLSMSLFACNLYFVYINDHTCMHIVYTIYTCVIGTHIAGPG